MTPPIITCERCKKEPSAKHVLIPKPLFLCWSCFDEWRKWYFGVNYIFCSPIEELKKIKEPEPVEPAVEWE